MSAPHDPWSDPGPGYTGPPPTTPPPGYGPGGYGPGGYGPGGYGPGGYGPPQPYYGYPPGFYGGPPGLRPDRRPGPVVGAAVLSFVQAAVVLIASLYVWFFASIADLAIQQNPTAAPTQAYEFAREGTVLAVVQLVSVVLLVAAGILALTRRGRPAWLVLLGAHVAQLVLTVHWWVQLGDLLGPAATGEEAGGVLAVFALFFAALPLVALGLVVFGGGRRWFTGPQA